MFVVKPRPREAFIAPVMQGPDIEQLQLCQVLTVSAAEQVLHLVFPGYCSRACLGLRWVGSGEEVSKQVRLAQPEGCRELRRPSERLHLPETNGHVVPGERAVRHCSRCVDQQPACLSMTLTIAMRVAPL
eukprot:COSAG01_NODE_3211_length_6414_cov_7.800475_7_plen_130_part_00